MTKKRTAILPALAMCAVLTGCGNTADIADTNAERSSAADAPTEDANKAEESGAVENAGETDETDGSETEESAAEESAADAADTSDDAYSNSIYSVDLDMEKWVSVTKYKDLLADYAADRADLFNTEQYSSFMNGIYFYADDIDDGYAVNVIFSEPTFDATMKDYTIADISDLLVQSVKTQMSTIDFMNVVSDEMVTYSGIDMLLIKSHCENGDIVYDCDEHIFLKDGYMCIISINYDEGDAIQTDFADILENVHLK